MAKLPIIYTVRMDVTPMKSVTSSKSGPPAGTPKT